MADATEICNIEVVVRFMNRSLFRNLGTPFFCPFRLLNKSDYRSMFCRLWKQIVYDTFAR